jgi:hypothetical protein
MLCGMARTDPQINLRIPAALKARLEESSVAAGRSITAEVVARLEATYDAHRRGSLESEIGALRERIEYLVSLAEGATPDRKTLQASKATKPRNR